MNRLGGCRCRYLETLVKPSAKERVHATLKCPITTRLKKPNSKGEPFRLVTQSRHANFVRRSQDALMQRCTNVHPLGNVSGRELYCKERNPSGFVTQGVSKLNLQTTDLYEGGHEQSPESKPLHSHNQQPDIDHPTMHQQGSQTSHATGEDPSQLLHP